MTIHEPPRDAESLEELIEDSFPHETEDAYLNWNGVRIALNYKYEVSTMVDDIVSMLAVLLEHPRGTSVIEWPSNCFRATWHLSWSEGKLTISANWITVTGRVETALQSAGALEIPVDAFIAEWSELVRFLASRLDLLAPSSGLEGLAEFQQIARATAKTRRGLLYRDLAERPGT